MALPEFFLQELKSRSDISDIAASYVDLKRRGKNLVGLCPFHNEKTGSFNIYPDNGSFYCFGCGAGGDIITFIMKIENLDYIEAVKFLAQRAGLQMPQDGVDDSMSRLRAKVLEINRESARFFHSCLMSPEGKKGLDYFTRRGMSLKSIKHFGLGYAPESKFALVNHLKKMKFGNDELVQANVAMPTRNGNVIDRFYGRVMFPIIDLRGNVVAFGGRILTDEKPKYINTSDTPVYHKSSGLFAMNFAKNSGGSQMILAEGYMDVIALHNAGFTNAIASLGTSLTNEQARIISRYAKEIVICYDSDAAGQKAAQRAIPILRETGLSVKVMSVPGGKDPDEFMKTNGADGPAKFKALIEACGNDVEYRLERLKQDYNMLSNDGKVRYLTAACEILATIDNDIEREVYAGKLSSDLSVDKNAILMQTKKAMRSRFKQRDKKQVRQEVQNLSGVHDRVNPEKARNLRIANAEEGIIAYLFSNPDGTEYVKKRLLPEKFCTAFNKRVYNFILGKNIYGAAMNMTDFSGDFTPDELSAIARMVARRDLARVTREDADEYISIINSEFGFNDPEKILNADDHDIQEYIKSLKNKKK